MNTMYLHPNSLNNTQNSADASPRSCYDDLARACGDKIPLSAFQYIESDGYAARKRLGLCVMEFGPNLLVAKYPGSPQVDIVDQAPLAEKYSDVRQEAAQAAGRLLAVIESQLPAEQLGDLDLTELLPTMPRPEAENFAE